MSNNEWIETTAKITSSEYQFTKLRDVDFEYPEDRSYFLVGFSYSVNGKAYVGDFESPSPYEVGQLIDISFNPSDPQENSHSVKPPHAVVRILFWTLGITAGLIIAYLAHRYGWEE
jgi:Protein of unknown function (DUF3592)